MTRSLPWTNHENATGESPVFFAEIALAHQTVSFALADLLPGPIQGRIQAWDAIFYQHRGGQDDLKLAIVNAPYSALGKAIRCSGRWEIDSTPSHDGSFASWIPASGSPFSGAANHAFMILVRAWNLADLPTAAAGLAIIAMKEEHFRFTLDSAGTVKLEIYTSSGWSTVATDAGAIREGELCALGFSWASGTATATYLRRNDRGDVVTPTVVVDPDLSSGAWPVIFNGDSDGAVANAGAEGRYCATIDFDDARWWNRALTSAQFQAAARRTLRPSEGLDANLVAWSRFDEGTGTAVSVVSRTGASITGALSGENDGALFSSTPAPSWISGITRDKFSDQIEAAYPIEGASVSIKICFGDPVSTTPVELFRGVVAELTSASRMLVELDCVDVAAKAHKILGTLVDKATYPKAPNDSVGAMIPIAFGAVPNVPGLRVAAAAQTRVAASFLTGDTSFSVASTADFPSTGTIRVDEEEITYTGKTSTTFTGLTRGASSTIATSHVTGAQAVEVTGETYLFADHALSAISNIRKRNSRGELLPADSGEYAVTLTAPARVVFSKPPQVLIRGEGSLWLEIDLEGPSAYDNSIDPTFACALHADWTELNFATINASKPKLSIRRTSNFNGPSLSSGVIKAYVVVEHHGLPATGGPLVTIATALNDVVIGTLGYLTAQTNTPNDAIQRGNYHTESAGFDAAHQHEIGGSVHTHDIGVASNSVAIRPLGSSQYWTAINPTLAAAIVSLFGLFNPATMGVNSPAYTATQFFLESVDPISDGDEDTGFTTTAATPRNIKLTFANLGDSKREMRRTRVVLIASLAAADYRVDFVVRGQVVAGMSFGNGTPNPMGTTPAGTSGRTTYASPYVDLGVLGYRIADLLRPDSYIEIFNVPTSPGVVTFWEIYLEVEIEPGGTSSKTARPKYDNWPKPLDRIRDGNYRTFEPHVFPCVLSGESTVPITQNQGFINPNPPYNGPDLPFNNQVQPTLRFFFTELDQPFATIEEANVVIAHSNSHAYGPHVTPTPGPFVPTKYSFPYPIGGFGLFSPSTVNPATAAGGAVCAPRYLVRLVIKGVTIASFNFSLDMSDAADPVYYDPATAPPGRRIGAHTAIFGSGQSYGPGTRDARVESSSGWQNLIGQALAGGNFKVQDLIDSTSYIEIVMPNPTAIDFVDRISPGAAGGDPNYSQQFSVYRVGGVPGAILGQKFFDVRLEYVARDTELEALPTDVGNTDAQNALRHSSLTWFDVTSFWLAVNDWSAITNIEFVAAGAFGASEFLRILRMGVVIEYGAVGVEDTHEIVADIDAGDGGNPIDHVERIFDDYIGSSYKNAAAFTAAAALVRTDAAGIVRDQINSGELIAKILRQYSCSWFWETGEFVPVFKPTFASIGAAALSLTVNSVVRDSVEMARTPKDEIFNAADVVYAPDLVKGGWGGKTTRNSSASQTAYGIIRTLLEGDWIRTAAAAAAWGDCELEYRDHVGVILALATYLNGLGLTRGDIVELVHDLRSTTKGEVLEMAIAPGGRGRPPMIRFTIADRTESL